MIRAEADASPAALPAQRTDPRVAAAPRWNRLRRWLAEEGWVHVVLLCGAALFLFPFAWMAGTSCKTDEELADNRLFPAIPRFRAASPYVRDAPEPRRPDDAPAARWDALLPRLIAQTADGLGPTPPVAAEVDRAAWRRAAAAVVVEKLAARLPREAWLGDDDAVLAALRGAQAAAPTSSRDAFDERLARIELTDVQWIADDARIAELGRGAALATAFAVENARLSPSDDAALLAYRFADGDAAPIALTLRFAVPEGFAPDALHQLIVSLRPDDSWHRVDAELDVGATRWVATRTAWLGQHRPLALVFQPPGFDDTTFRARSWIPLERRAGATLPAGRCELRLRIRPSGTLMAIAGKAWRNYDRAFHAVPFWTYVLNSLLLVGLTLGGALFSSAFVAYAFARLRWPGRGVAVVLLLATMMLPGQVTMIPSFLIWRGLGWYNTLNPMWVPAWFGNAFFIFLMMQQMKTIPKELEEAARIDGFNAVQTWWYVIVPQVKPTLAGIAIMTFMGAWNEFMGPLIFLRDQARFPLSLGLYGMSLEGSDWAMLMAGNLLMTLPVVAIFFACQRYFIQGVTMTGVKG